MPLYFLSLCSVHAFVYDPTTGSANRLRVDFSAYLKDLRQVYDLYKPDADLYKPGSEKKVSAVTTQQEQVMWSPFKGFRKFVSGDQS